MPAPDRQTCEVKIDEAWRSASLIEAKGVYAMVPKRCPAFHGPVMIAGTYTIGGALKLQHHRLHNGCPPTPKTHSRTASWHPLTLT